MPSVGKGLKSNPRIPRAQRISLKRAFVIPSRKSQKGCST